jgi:glutathione synthase/RimK-type ligase-like ATP-grasp enzyme/gamma-glutamyl:cysteine ligase YbdK (ATP-grasp superfamily)
VSRPGVLVVVTDRADAGGLPATPVVTARAFIEGGADVSAPGRLVVNLCRTLGYGSDGYYVSLLADARGQQVLPRLETSAGVADPYARFRALQEAGIATVDAAELAVRRRAAGLDAGAPAAGTAPAGGLAAGVAVNGGPGVDADPEGLGPRPLLREGGTLREPSPDECIDIVACFGATPDARFRGLAAALFRVWPAPLLRVRLLLEEAQWKVAGVAHASPALLDEAERRLLARTLESDLRGLRRRGASAQRDTVRASIAVLLDAFDPFSASSAETIDRFEKVAAQMNVHVARITASDLRRLPEYDALFIRSLTGVTLPSFQFALRAEALDMPVVDDSQSIIRCGNKVYLEELLRREGVPLPRTRIVTAQTAWSQVAELGVPFVVKSPDGSFSAGVHKIGSAQEYGSRTRELLAQSPLLIAQEWLPTDFDWRITVLDGRLLFAARYYMAHGHWQIRTEEGGVERYGKVEAVARGDAPRAVVDVALRAAALIGRGMYGVDIKETPAGPVVIEVNDNPNLDAGYEDAVDGDVIYEDIVRYFVARVEAGQPSGAMTGGAAAGGMAGAPPLPGPPPRTARPEGTARPVPAAGGWGFFEVAGLELEYPTVDASLEVRALVEPAFRVMAGRGTSDIELDGVGFSNEIADHVFEVKTLAPVRTMTEAEAVVAAGVARFSEVLRREWDARLLPTAMHPWFDPHDGRLWTRSGLRIYTTYAQIFNVRTHGWMNVHATHLNLPFGDERETMALHTAAALLLPYLPALAASSPVHDGVLQDTVDSRLAWILEHQARIPETCGDGVPEYVESFADYRREILQPMYRALSVYPHSAPIRHEFLNSRGAVLRFARRALEVRVLDTQECVRMDAAIAAFVRAALRELTDDVLAGLIDAPPHHVLVADFLACVRHGSRAPVKAPHLGGAADGGIEARHVLRRLLERVDGRVGIDDAGYLALVDGIIEHGSLAERIRARLQPHAGSAGAMNAALREVYGELADCLERNQPWPGRQLRQDA